MPVKIRLARHGKKRYAYYHIVVADSRSPRDGRFIERIGSYNPNTNPATIDLNFEKALSWIGKGAQPTDTTRTILSNAGVMFKHHLLTGVRKNALTEAEAETKFNIWKTDKLKKSTAEIEKLAEAAKSDDKKRFEAEVKINETRAAEIAKRNSVLATEVADAEKVETTEKVDATETKKGNK